MTKPIRLVETDSERYKLNTLIILMIIAYAYMHFSLNGLYVDTTFDKLVAFTVRKPYVYRVLIPWLAHFLEPFLSLAESFFLLELLTVSLLYLSVVKLFKTTFQKREATLFSLLFFIFLSLTFIINYRFIIQQPGTFYFPYDTPAVLFTILGLHFCLRKQFICLYPLIILATLNRESSILIVFMLPALYMGTRARWFPPFCINLILYGFVRVLIGVLFFSHGGEWMELTHQTMHISHLVKNMAALIERQALLWFIAEMAFMPALWFAVSNYIPRTLKGLRFIALFYIIGLFLVGNILEGRIWGETVALLYYPTMLGIKNWLNGHPASLPTDQTVRSLAIHYAVPIITGIALILGLVSYFQQIH